jgi:hypothetical protein
MHWLMLAQPRVQLPLLPAQAKAVPGFTQIATHIPHLVGCAIISPAICASPALLGLDEVARHNIGYEVLVRPGAPWCRE